MTTKKRKITIRIANIIGHWIKYLYSIISIIYIYYFTTLQMKEVTFLTEY